MANWAGWKGTLTFSFQLIPYSLRGRLTEGFDALNVETQVRSLPPQLAARESREEKVERSKENVESRALGLRWGEQFANGHATGKILDVLEAKSF